MEHPEVSVLMTSFNHEPYIAEAIESALSQITSFEYEIIIFDDKSTDRSREIINEYQQKCPNKIRTIFPEENQYSKGKSSLCDFLIPAARGTYIAQLECDDCWTDANKLQRQYDFMESNASCALCSHSVELFDDSAGSVKGVSNPCKDVIKISTSEIIDKGGAVLATCSYFARHCDLDSYLSWRPKVYPVGDWPLMLFLSLMGEVCCLPYVMGRYRTGVSTSWTGTRVRDKKLAADFDKDMVEMLDELIDKLPPKYESGLVEKQAVYVYDYAFRESISIPKAIAQLRFDRSLLGIGLRTSLAVKYCLKMSADKLGLMNVIESLLLKIASR